jgi:hypothetical protein
MNILGASLQPPLVSGTNIQSVNNTSLLQSGNRNIIKGLHILLPPVSGGFYGNNLNSGGGNTNQTQVANRIVLSPFFPANSITSSQLSIYVSAFASGSLARILVYSNGSTNQPLTKLLESPDLNCSTNGTKSWTTTYTFEAGTIYWVGIQMNTTPSTLFSWTTLAALTTSVTSTAGTSYSSYITTSYSFGSAPALMNLANLSLSSINAQLIITSA